MGYTIEGEIIFYDQDIYVRPVYSKLTYDLFTDPRPELRPLYNSYTDTNRPSTRIYMDERGLLNERLADDPLFWDATDPRSWKILLDIGDERHERYLENLETESH
ncbi:MAG: hypothetical protein ACJ0S4_08145 [Candidatus Rariloculaceae bacterium]